MTADETIDATGKYVIPGGIDVHTHMELPFGGTFAKDTFETGTRAAAFGGTTSIVDFAVQSRGESPARGPRRLARQGRGQRRHRLRLPHDHERRQRRHPGRDGRPRRRGRPRLQAVHRLPGRLLQRRRGDLPGDAADREERRADHDARRERDGHRRRRARPVAAGTTDPIGHGLARKPIFEGEATNRVIRLAEAAEVPVYIVHLSARDALDAVRDARDRGKKAFAETCPQYLFLSLDDLGNGFEGAKFVCSPPLRTKDHWDELWTGLVKDDLQLVVDRPLPVRLPRPEGARPRRLPQDPERPARRRGPARPAPRRRRRRRPDHRERWVEIISTAPAKLFGMYPRKGAIAVGSDADLVVYDPNREAHDLGATTHHMDVDYSCYEGRSVQGGGRRPVARLGRRPGRRVHRPQGPRQVHQARAGRLRPDGLTVEGAADAGQVVVLDGGLATELEARGHDLSDRLWSARLLLTEPDAIEAAHLAYFRAGAGRDHGELPGVRRRVRGGGARSRDGLGSIRSASSSPDRARDRSRRSPATRLGLLVAGSVGPYGANLADGRSTAATTPGRRRLARVPPAADRGPRRGGADLLAIETIPTVREAEVIVGLLDEFDATGVAELLVPGCRTQSAGEPVEAAVALGEHPRVVAVGVNCTAPRFLPGLLARGPRRRRSPLIAYPNGGDRWDARREPGSPMTAGPRPGAGGGVARSGSDLARWLLRHAPGRHRPACGTPAHGGDAEPGIDGAPQHHDARSGVVER